MNLKKKAIIFDFDGVILNSHKIKSNVFYSLIKKKYSISVAKKFLKYHLNNIGLSRFKKFQYLNKITNQKINLREINQNFDQEINKNIYKLKINPNLNKFLIKNYKSKYLFISTGTPQNKIKEIIKRKNLKKYFREIHGSPHSKIQHIKKIKKKYNFKNSDLIFIGDSISDYEAAKKNNLDFILKANSENIKIKQLLKKQNVLILYNYKKLQNLLN